jgi:L-aminopeptidase/D-esterase-like protein
MQYLEERAIGFDMRVARVPIVVAAILFDLALGDPKARPDPEMGYTACQIASDGPVAEGNVGAGTGATVGKVLGHERSMKSGLGSTAIELGGGLMVGALVAVNAIGDVVDPRSGSILAGARKPDSDQFINTLAAMKNLTSRARTPPSSSTVIGVVATNARLTKEEANKMAQMAQDGIARTVRPAHTMFDGDTLFALSTGNIRADISVVGAYAVEAVAEAIERGIKAAEGVAGLPAWKDLASSD